MTPLGKISGKKSKQGMGGGTLQWEPEQIPSLHSLIVGGMLSFTCPPAGL